MFDFIAVLVILVGGAVTALLLVTGIRLFLADAGDYEMNRAASRSLKAVFTGRVPTDSEGDTGATRQYGMAVTKDGTVVSQGAISDHAMDRVVR